MFFGLFGESYSQLKAVDKTLAVIEFKLDGTIIKANRNFLDVMGFESGEIKGKHHSMFVSSDYAKSRNYERFWDRLRSGEFVSDTFKRISKSGKEVWIQASYTPVLNIFGRPYKVVKFAMDVSQQTRDFADFKGQIEAINKVQAVIHFDLNGNIIDANPLFLDAVGYSIGEIKGKHHSLFVEPAYAQSKEYQDFWDNLRNGQYQSHVFKRIGKGGKEIWIRASYNPIMDLEESHSKSSNLLRI